MEMLLDRFLTYVQVDTQSRVQCRNARVPSSEGQWQLAKILAEELEALGCVDISLSNNCCLMATLPATVSEPLPVIGFVAHLDTAPDYSGKNVRPQLVENYRGGDIALGIGDEILSPVLIPVLHQLHGHTLITTEGKTLLGADDKAGIAEIMTALARLKQQQRPHGTIRVAFTPDEETGTGSALFDIEAFGADWAYTVDGGGCGEFEYENFNAGSAVVKITGNSAHTGEAKGKLVNALELAWEFHRQLPADEKPENTEGYQGFYHLESLKGNAARAELHYMIRDFNWQDFQCRQQQLQALAEQINQQYAGKAMLMVSFCDSYRNMREKIEAQPQVISLALQAMKQCGIEPKIKPVRGGTDGAVLSWRGLPCPNLFTGGFNFHGKHEFASLNIMDQSVQVIMKIAELAVSGGER
ncbi:MULTISPECIES: peptidase T [unclassified Tatumella]|uniref:peptidase T n=1 Tax=unclassified Tatumella TaxID=2649542 RepID=UPI001BAF251D|nr:MULTISPECIES: peptidase T [unclassified Tatumella]MBS0877625.1 peptidase T [Tatumella sp. JGM82]MBS0891330.1 peptidase T [Tatumella sp. JGM94]MBS0902157.1 peptidase T [Tatumella sp. JGM100]